MVFFILDSCRFKRGKTFPGLKVKTSSLATAAIGGNHLDDRFKRIQLRIKERGLIGRHLNLSFREELI